MGTQEGDTVERQLFSSSSSAAAFVESGVQDSCEDSCSICLEPFCHSDPATITYCKHEYHVQCILEWAQRSKECPMCWQLLSLKDPLSQELLDAVEQEQAWRHLGDDAQLQQAPGFASYNDIQEQIMQHLTQQMAQIGSLQNTRVSDMHMERPADGALAATGGRTLTDNRWTSRIRQQRADRHQSSVEPAHERPPALEDSDSLKSRFLVASAKCKETFTRTSRSLKERWRGRSNNAEDFRARAQEVSASVVRQALKRITPSDGNEDAPTTSTGLASTGKQGTSRCHASDQLEGAASREALS
ncbi:hypothetical protein L7F22_037944 [Adiantum nelumboides]|nr:hypothetical protein [Adiantum nelumboides]